jgi:pimeloyl-ACP methyl ester carboxylesterase
MLGGIRPEADGRWIWSVDPVLRVPGPVGRLNPAAEVFYGRLARVTSPTLLVVGAESFQAESAKRMAAASSDKPLVTLARTGHWVPLDNPGSFIDIVSEYLNDGANSSS